MNSVTVKPKAVAGTEGESKSIQVIDLVPLGKLCASEKGNMTCIICNHQGISLGAL